MVDRQGGDRSVPGFACLQPLPGEPLITTQMAGNPEISVRTGERSRMSDLGCDRISKLRHLQ